MADIKGLDIFGNNKGLAKIKKEAEAKKKQQAITPSEIAISIAAEIIRCRANFRPEKLH